MFLHNSTVYAFIKLCVITVPSCYVETNCIGEPINSSITFAECCTNFGVSFDFDGQCQPCPSTSRHLYICNSSYVCMYVHMLCAENTSVIVLIAG